MEKYNMELHKEKLREILYFLTLDNSGVTVATVKESYQFNYYYYLFSHHYPNSPNHNHAYEQ